MSIRLRLTLLYSAILALTLLVFGTAIYVSVSRVTAYAVKDSLKAELGRAKKNVFYNPYTRQYFLSPDDFATKTTYFQFRTTDGGVRSHMGDGVLGEATSLGDAGLWTLRTGMPRFETVRPQGADTRFGVWSEPITIAGKTVGILQAARSIEQYDATLDTLQRNLTIGSILATLFAFGIGWMLAGAALRPIDRITQTARAIGAEQDFARRVPYTHANDEVGRLASTFNTMLAQLGGAYTQVETALRAQRRFVADASHELRTPLTSIRGNVALLGRQPPIAEEDRSAVLADTEEETDRLIRLVNDLLLLARADAGRPLKSEPVAVGTLIDDVCRQARGLASGRRVECEDAGDLAVLADRDSLKQVILILLDNALKFSSPDTPVTIAVTEAEGQVTTSVRDVGPGIEPDKLPHIFERFYRGDVSRSGTGSGLGLAIAKQLTEAQHGDLTVRSEVGKGSTFTVSLPRATSTSALQMDRAAATESVK